MPRARSRCGVRKNNSRAEDGKLPVEKQKEKGNLIMKGWVE
jgi:hypothetical protein